MNKKILSLSALAILGASSLFSATLGAAQMAADTQMTTFGDVMGPVDPDTGRMYGTYEDEDLNEFFAGEDIADVPYVSANDMLRDGSTGYGASIGIGETRSFIGGTGTDTVMGYVNNVDPSGAYARYDIRMVNETRDKPLRDKKLNIESGRGTTLNSTTDFNAGSQIRLGVKVLDVQGTKTTIRSELGVIGNIIN